MTTLALPRNPLRLGSTPLDRYLRLRGEEATIGVAGYMAFRRGEPKEAPPGCKRPDIYSDAWQVAADFILRGKA